MDVWGIRHFDSRRTSSLWIPYRSKITKRFFTLKGYRAKECLDLMHYEYLITFIKDYSRFEYIYLMHRKFDSLDKVESKAELKKQLGKHIKAFLSNRSGEYIYIYTYYFIKEGCDYILVEYT